MTYETLNFSLNAYLNFFISIFILNLFLTISEIWNFAFCIKSCMRVVETVHLFPVSLPCAYFDKSMCWIFIWTISEHF